jgi:hypothetical protein
MFAVSRAELNAIHYAGMLGFKMAVFVLFLFPYIGIRMVMKKR